MNKISCLLVLSIVFSFSIANAAERYVNGVDKNHPPFSFIDEKTGQPTGFDVDAMTWISQKMGFEIEHRATEWDGIILELITGEIDMICSGMSITEDRKMLVIYSNPYWSTSKVFVIDKRSEINISDILTAKIKLGVRSATTEASEIASEKKCKKYPFEIQYYAAFPIMLKELLIGNIDAIYMDNYTAKAIVAKADFFKIAGTHGETENFAVAFRKDDKALKNMISDGYKLLMADPYWKELQHKYIVK